MPISETALESYRPEIVYKETGTLNELYLDKLLNEKSKYMVTSQLLDGQWRVEAIKAE
ncbi:MAG: hypothetical protein KC422_25500 [Trueperaceae bacterium]|nr:hypothetical protein [Trueperaceae bacterium]